MRCRLTRPNLEASVSTTIRRARSTMRWLRRASASSWVVRPNCRSRPSTPRNRVSKLYELRLASAWLPCSDSDCWRNRPPVSSTLMPAALASSQAMFSPLVITVTSRCVRRWRARVIVVEPESMMMLSPGRTRRAAHAPIDSFSGRFSASFSWMSCSCGGVRTSVAPPWVRLARPCDSKWVRSARMVTADTPKRSTRSATCTEPCSISSCRICCRRERVLRMAILGVAGKGRD